MAALVALIVILSIFQFMPDSKMEEIKASPNTTVKYLSDYFTPLRGTVADTPVYIKEGKEPGGTLFILCGSHSKEIASTVSAVVIIENLKVQKGRVIVIPRANQSGARNVEPFSGNIGGYYITTSSGEKRYFRIGGRRTRPADQYPDPLYYKPPSGGEWLLADEARNINRCYPGIEDGWLTEKLSFAIIELIKKEKVDIAFDLHEAPPFSRLINTLVTHPKSVEIATDSLLNLSLEGVEMRLEISSETFQGLSHKEWGDYTEANSFLIETTNPIQNKFKSALSNSTILEGIDKNYELAIKKKVFQGMSSHDKVQFPLQERVGVAVSAINEIVKSYNLFYPEKEIIISGLPSYEDLSLKGVGAYLR